MKLEEAIALMAKNNKLKFIGDHGVTIYTDKEGKLRGQWRENDCVGNEPSLNMFLSFVTNWQPLLEPVGFLEAINTGKKIRPHYTKGMSYDFEYLDFWLKGFWENPGFTADKHLQKNRLYYLNGLWDVFPN